MYLVERKGTNEMNAQLVNHGYEQARNYVVESDAFCQVSFGYIELTNFPNMNAICVEFHGGAEYIFVCVPDALYEALEAICVQHIETNGAIRVGSFFSRHLFNGFRGYARLNQ